jgi:hypothetical protein
MVEGKYFCQFKEEWLLELAFDCANKNNNHQKDVFDIVDDKNNKTL